MKDVAIVVGHRDTVLGFRSIGLSTLFWEKSKEQNLSTLETYISNGTKIIFFTENIVEDIQLTIQKYQNNVYPMFVVIPSLGQENTRGKQYIQDLVVQALGSASFDNK